MTVQIQSTEPNLKLRLWTVEEYHRIAEAGILGADERVELLEGKIIWMIAKGTAHTSAVVRTDYLLKNLFGTRAWVSSQNPVQLNARSEPEPDIAVIKVNQFWYADHHPTPSEVYLIIEVADSSLKLDCDIKAKAYSQAGIKDYWVLDIVGRQLHIFREPTQDGYQIQLVLAAEEIVSPLEFPDLQIIVAQMLPLVR